MSWQARVRPVVEDILQARGVSGAVFAVSRDFEPPDYLVVGSDAAGVALAPDTLFPVASVTKLATALTVLRLVASGAWALDDPVGRYAPEAAIAAEGVTLRMLLCHTSGLTLDISEQLVPHDAALDWPKLARGCLATPLTTPPLRQVRYSNLGPGVLAALVERVTGTSFKAVLREQVLEPLHLEAFLGEEPPRPPAKIRGDFGRFAGTELEPYNTPFWRALALPWSGLITTAAGALGLVGAFAGNNPGFLPTALLAEATRNQTGELSGGFFAPLMWAPCPWGLGIELRGDKHPHWTSDDLSARTFGHAGASGCQTWFDPASGISFAMLGTRNFERWWQKWPAIVSALIAAIAT
jgi:beta-lactamase class C